MRLRVWVDKLIHGIWALFLITLPVSSFPYFPGFLGKSALVRPLALYPLMILVMVALLPRLFTKRLPRTYIPYLIFILVASISTSIAFTRGINPPIDVHLLGRVLTTVLTLVIGSLFYFTISILPQNESDFKFTLTWIYIGFTISLIWASFQIIYILRFDQDYFNFLNKVQSAISIRKLFDKRISGMTYEPSWFAEQLTLVLMPMLFGSVISKYSVFRWRYRWITFELILLVWAAIAVLFTYSRGGLAVFIVLVVLSLFMAFWRNIRGQPKMGVGVLKILLVTILILVILGLIVFAAAQKNNYFSRLWSYWTDEEAEGTYFYYIAFSQRFVHWETAYRIFRDYPWLGVGLGNYTFYYDEYLPDRPYRNPDIYKKLVPEEGRNQIVTVKNFTLRILAETGIFGFFAFTTFLVALAGCVGYLLFSPEPEAKLWGRVGLLGLIAFLPVTLSVDSFAIPNMWVVFGLITASTRVFNR
jgi:O-antigen ligase